MLVYLITNKINGKQYVGQTVQSLDNRWKTHCSNASGCLAIKSAINKYGKENFIIEEIFKATSVEELNKTEQEFINKFNTLAPHGYNLKTGGNRPTYSEESKKKMSESQMGRIPWNKGLTKEDPRVASYIRGGEDHHYWGKSSSRKGVKCSLETIDKISKANSGKKRAPEHLNAITTGRDAYYKTAVFISIVCHENGKTYKSIKLASKDLGIGLSSIYQVLNGSRNSVNGYTFSKVGSY